MERCCRHTPRRAAGAPPPPPPPPTPPSACARAGTWLDSDRFGGEAARLRPEGERAAGMGGCGGDATGETQSVRRSPPLHVVEKGTGIKRTRSVPYSSNDVLNSARSVVSSSVESVTPGAGSN